MSDPHAAALLRHQRIRQQHNLPPVLTQAKTAAASVAKFALGGFQTVPDNILKERAKICLACEFWDPAAFRGLGRCAKCGCSSAKLKMPHEKCPIGKWGPEPLLTSDSNP
jgi:hypothetical protein